MDNQQAKLSDLELGWLAGFIDGEGSINIHQSSKKGYRYIGWQPWFTIGNTHIATLNRVSQMFDILGFAYHVSWDMNRKLRRDGVKRKPFWRIGIVGLKRMHRFLIVITPLLSTKRYQAELFLDFVNLRLNNPGWRRGLSKEEEAIIPKLVSANH